MTRPQSASLTSVFVLFLGFLHAFASPDSAAQTSLVDSLILNLQSTKNSIRINAAHRLGQLRAPQAVPSLIAVIANDKIPLDLSDAAEDALVRIGTPAVDALILELLRGTPRLQASAARLLGRIKDPAAILPLIEALDYYDVYYHPDQYAQDALVLMGSIAVNDLIRALGRTEVWKIPRGAAICLGEIKDPQAVEPLIQVIMTRDLEFPARHAAIDALGKIGDPRAVRLFQSILTAENDWGGARYVVDALVLIEDPRVLEILKAALSHEDKRVRRDAANALKLLVLDSSSPADSVRLFIAVGDVKSLSAMGSAVAPILITVLSDGPDGLRVTAASALGEIGDRVAVQPLIVTLRSVNVDVRENAVKALGQIGDPICIPFLIDLLRDADYFVREQATYSLMRFDDPTAKEAIEGAQVDLRPLENKADVLARKGPPTHKGHSDTSLGYLETWVYGERCPSSIYGRGDAFFIYFDSTGKVVNTRCDRGLTIRNIY